jgi:hypothetical protein
MTRSCLRSAAIVALVHSTAVASCSDAQTSALHGDPDGTVVRIQSMAENDAGRVSSAAGSQAAPARDSRAAVVAGTPAAAAVGGTGAAGGAGARAGRGGSGGSAGSAVDSQAPDASMPEEEEEEEEDEEEDDD